MYQNDIVNYPKIYTKFFLFLLVSYTMLVLVSPLLLSYMIVFILIYINFNVVYIRYVSEFYFAIAVAFVSASIKINYGISDDFYNVYMPVMDGIRSGVSIFNFFSGGVEFGLPLYFYIINLIQPDLTYIEIKWLVTFSFTILYIICLERFYLHQVESKYKSLALAAMLVFFNYIVMPHLMRQALATIFILYSIGYWQENKKNKSFIFYIIASICHLSSVLIIPMFLIFLSDSKKLKNILLAMIVFFSISFEFMVKFILSTGILSVATYKFQFYSNDDIETTAGAGFVLHMIVLFLLSFFITDKKYEPYKSLIRYSVIAYISLVQIPFASDRLFMPLTACILGFLFFISTKKVATLFKVLLSLYCIYRVFRLGAYSDNIYLLWTNYPWLDPFSISFLSM